jgi:hypothetical protein
MVLLRVPSSCSFLMTVVRSAGSRSLIFATPAFAEEVGVGVGVGPVGAGVTVGQTRDYDRDRERTTVTSVVAARLYSLARDCRYFVGHACILSSGTKQLR